MFERYFHLVVLNTLILWAYNIFALQTTPLLGLLSAILLSTLCQLGFPLIGRYYRTLRKKVKFL